ncbi:signal recognition particle-docking protein FtsY [Psychrobacter sp. SZ93C1]|uniref:signal recognition particle-docking protein FtsY n=1 Tax=Psychrobacter sp. SZ93C1 TaxID=2792058 RepID=UPI002A0A776F|nr:signal recognition particle-docking protein FtsY [Psychrobacter sp. SZ93C1]
MNNPNNNSRVVINLDGDLDDLDDDDITLPSLSAQSVPIIDETVDVAAVKKDSTVNKEVPSINAVANAADNIALGSPIESDTVNKDNAATPSSISTAPTMPLQDQLGDTSAVSAASSNSQAVTQTVPESVESQENNKKGSWFNRMKTGLSKSRKNLAEGMVSILIGGKEIDDELLEEVEDQLLVADIGVNATNRIIKSLTEQTARGDLIYAHSLYKALQSELVDILTPKVAPLVIDSTKKPFVILVVGVNGVGKTTTIGKLAKRLQGEGKSVMLAAGDTFRAAATEQLQIWGERNNIPVVAQGHGSDSASVIFDAMQSAKAKNIDVLIADTAGRLQNKTHLMAELEKVVRVMRKADPSAPHEGMIVLDAGTGQNAINQVELFNKIVPLTGITITKLDGTAKGGVVFNIAETTDVPIRYIGVGESIDDLRAFSPKQFVAALFETDDKE